VWSQCQNKRYFIKWEKILLIYYSISLTTPETFLYILSKLPFKCHRNPTRCVPSALLQTGRLRHEQHTYFGKGHTKCAAYVEHACLWTAGGISPSNWSGSSFPYSIHTSNMQRLSEERVDRRTENQSPRRLAAHLRSLSDFPLTKYQEHSLCGRCSVNNPDLLYLRTACMARSILLD